MGSGARVTIAFDDGVIPHRPMRQDFRKIALETVIQILLNVGVRLADIKLICANGLHSKWTRRELATLIGDEIALDPFDLWDLFCEEFAHRPEYVHKYRYGRSFHGSHPFFLWNATLWPKEYLGEIWLAGADREVAERLGFRAFPTVERALRAARRKLGRDFSLTVWTGERLGIARVV